MKNFVRSGSVLLAFLCPLAIAGRASATVVWTATFEADKSGDVCGSNKPGAEFTAGVLVTEGTRINAEVLGEKVYSGNLACKVTVHPDDIFTQSYNQNRVDVKHNSTLTGEGKDMYLSGYYYLAADAQTRDEFGMFETTNSVNWIDIWVEPKTGGGTSINLGIESSGADLGSVHVWNGDFSPGTWHQIAIHVHWSQDATKGSLDFWLDGKQVVTGYKHKTKPNQYDLYYLTGLHRVVMQPYTESIYFDDFIEADSQNDIKIGSPMAGGGTPDGGVDAADSGSSGGSAGMGMGGTTGAAGQTGTGGVAGGTGTTGTAGTGTMGTAGTTGAAGSSVSGTGGSGEAGMSSTGAAGSNTTGAAGTSGASRHSSSGCAIAGATRQSDLAFGLFSFIALGAALRSRRRRRAARS